MTTPPPALPWPQRRMNLLSRGVGLPEIRALQQEQAAAFAAQDRETAAHLQRMLLEAQALWYSYQHAASVLVPSSALARYGIPLPDAPEEWQAARKQATLHMIGEYFHKTQDELLSPDRSTRSRELWKQHVPDYATATNEQLGRFYAAHSEENPGYLVVGYLESMWGLAIRQMAVSVARSLGSRALFDYGGGSGVVCQIARSVGIQEAICIEPAGTGAGFCRWQTEVLGMPSIGFVAPEAASALHGLFDFGVCTEVLEHLLDVEGAVRQLHALLRPGGVLFLTASFHLVGPEWPDHLPQNRPWHEKTPALMQAHGFERFHPPSQDLPLLPHWGFWRKRS